MKKLIPLMILATVVSCGKKENKKDGADMIINKLTDLQKVGLITIETSKGESEGLDINDKNEVVGFKSHKFSDTTKKIVLKKENSLVYSLEINKSDDSSEHRSVILEDTMDTANQLREMIESGKAEVKGNNLIANFEDELSYDGEVNGVKYDVKSKMKIKYVRNLKSDCDSKTDISFVNGIGTLNGKETKLKDGKTSNVESCGGIMSKDELKALDLSKIQFCDERVKDSNCENDKDMSFLTSDL